MGRGGMKKLYLFSLIFLISMISACSTTTGYWGSEYWQEENAHLEGNQYIAADGRVQTYEAPRKYHITSEDMEKYDAINDRIAQRRAQIQQQTKQQTSNSNSEHTTPSATYNPYAPPANNYNNSANHEPSNN